MTAASALEPLLSYLGLDLCERGAGLKVIGAPTAEVVLSAGALADHEREPVLARRELIEAPSALTLRCYDLDRDYQALAVHARSEVEGGPTLQLDLGLSLSAAQARAFARRTLSEARRVREAVTMDVGPLELLRFEAGDAVRFDGRPYRIAESEDAERPTLTLAPVSEPAVVIPYEPSGGTTVSRALLTGFWLLDLPPFGADERNGRPVLAATAVPFSGVDIYAGTSASTLTLRGRVDQAAGVGTTLQSLPAGQVAKWNRPACLYIYLENATLQTRSEADVLSGENFICVRGAGGEWEIIQFLRAQMIAPRQWRLSGLLRGQWGTQTQPMDEGASVIVLPEVVRADVSDAEHGLPRLWRAGLSGFGAQAQGAIDIETVWTGIGLRPRAPVHGRIRREAEGLHCRWIRCARYGGDSLDYEPPLEDGYEAYRLCFYQGTDLRREVEVTQSAYIYGSDAIAADYPAGFDGLSRVEIAQKDPTSRVGLALEMSLSA
ncbi:phage tail protein [Asticcacaulis sp. W401b]|uniref:phage tail protein n=1 Tax=Asticcacaulis sp. W401b TaxID=3388666 RepID=UPI003970B725